MTSLEPNEIKRYFEQQAAAWLESSYRTDGETFPVGWHRARIISEALSAEGRKLKVLDLGCGGGRLSIFLAELGHNVVGVDQSETMLDIAARDLAGTAPETQARVRFVNGPVDSFDIQEGPFDAVLAMGLIGYLPNDKMIFDIAKRHLVDRGRFFVSCRNRLFNMSSLTWRTLREIKQGHAPALLHEIDALYATPISDDVPGALVTQIANNLEQVKAVISSATMPEVHGDMTEGQQAEARQHVPSDIERVAKSTAFDIEKFYAVHPHMLDPRLERLLPAVLANKLSEAMTGFEAQPAALPTASVFIASLRRK